MPADDNGQRNPLPRLTIYLGIPMKYIESVLKNEMKLKSVTSDYIHEKEAKNYCKILGTYVVHFLYDIRG